MNINEKLETNFQYLPYKFGFRNIESEKLN